MDRRFGILGFIVPGATATLVDGFSASLTQMRQLLFAEPMLLAAIFGKQV